ncbi:MAG: hypothetical protein GX495_18315 [Chloroflexi bacterium]|jgi:hypothetical protein|nr:hypothetical protein [Chloroflexota bacterium]
MLEELRAQAAEFVFEDEPEDDDALQVEYDTEPKKYFLGMAPWQRFIVSLLLFVIVFLTGVFALLITERIYLAI